MKNLVILIGRIAAAPETRQAGDTAITSFTLVTDRPKIVDGKAVKNDKGYTETLAEFHRVTAFNGLGTSVAKHKQKGDVVEVQGRLHYSKWTDREGVERFAVETAMIDLDSLFWERDIETAARRLETIQRYVHQQGMISKQRPLEELFEDTDLGDAVGSEEV